MKRIAAAAALSLALLATSDTSIPDDNPNFLDLNEHLITVCNSWMRDHKGLQLSNRQIFEAGLCQGYMTAALRLIMEKECAQYVYGRTPGWSTSAAIQTMNRLWYANSQDNVFRTSSPEHIMGLVVNDVLGPKETREARCKSSDLGRSP